MKKGCKIALVGGLAVVVGAVACWKWMIRMPLGEFARCALYMAVMDDEICRNELEGNRIGDEVITFPPKEESLQYRYHLFLQMNLRKTSAQLQEEIADIGTAAGPTPFSKWRTAPCFHIGACRRDC